MGTRNCKHFEDSGMVLKCSDKRKCESCQMDKYFYALLCKGYQAGVEDTEAEMERMRKGFVSQLKTTERLQDTFTVHDSRGRLQAIKGNQIKRVIEPKLGGGTIIETTNGKIRCQEDMEIVRMKINGTYDVW